MLELLDDRYGNRSTLVTSQMPVDKWHALIGDPTQGDAILDRLVHNTYRIELKGESMRRRATKLTATGSWSARTGQASLSMGLDIGGDTPEAVALAVLAKMTAVLNERRDQMLKWRERPIRYSELCITASN